MHLQGVVVSRCELRQECTFIVFYAMLGQMRHVFFEENALLVVPERDLTDRAHYLVIRYFGVTPLFLEGAYHDCMLGPVWHQTAAAIEGVIEGW